MLKRFQKAGHQPIALIGGGTGMIGDPSGRDSERSLNTADTVKGFSDKLEQQLGQLLQFDDGENAVKARNNQDRKSTRLNSSHVAISYAVFCLKKKKRI